MTEQQDVDTTTPLDGDGRNVTGLDEQFTSSDNVKQEEYETRGQTTVVARRGYAFNPSDKDIPTITSDGLKVTKEEAEKIVAESEGVVSILRDDENEEG